MHQGKGGELVSYLGVVCGSDLMHWAKGERRLRDAREARLYMNAESLNFKNTAAIKKQKPNKQKNLPCPGFGS